MSRVRVPEGVPHHCKCSGVIRPVGQAVKTAASHAANMGSIPVRVTITLHCKVTIAGSAFAHVFLKENVAGEPAHCSFVSYVYQEGSAEECPPKRVHTLSLDRCCGKRTSERSFLLTFFQWKSKLVLIAVRVHPFPSRTRKLSSLAPKILVWRRTGKIGNANIKTE